MTSDEIGGIVRAILAALGGVAVGKGWMDNATMITISGALATLAVGVWSIVAKRRTAK
jgi:glycerol-3-phosphate dehydrogenase